jgi:Holliday junction resolvase RusA-like endonuclease
MNLQQFTIDGVLPGLEQMLQAAKRRYGKTNAYAVMKRDAENRIWYSIRQAKLNPMLGAVNIVICFNEPNRKRDKDNVIGGGVKIILDALRHSGIIKNDTWRCIGGIYPSVFCVPGKGSITVTLTEVL